MTAPNMRSMDIDEFDALVSDDTDDQEKLDQEKAKVQDAVLEGDEVPEELKGKAVKDVVQAYKGLSEGFKKSEEERHRLAMRPLETPQRIEQPQTIQQEPEPTDEAIRELYDRDPVAAQRVIAQVESKRTQQKLYDERVSPITHTLDSLVATQELLARQRHAEVFDKYGDEIKSAMGGINKSALTSPNAWDDVVSWIKGKHISDFVDMEVQKRLKTQQEDQRSKAGATVRPTGQSLSGPAPVLDALEREVMQKMGIFKTEKEYIKWKGSPKSFTVED